MVLFESIVYLTLGIAASPAFSSEIHHNAGSEIGGQVKNIDAFPLPAQARLNKVIQTGEYYRESSTRIRRINVRFITALLHDPAIYAKKANLSSDLFHHLTINSIHIPPLRERAEDIPLLVQYFLGKELKKTGDNTTDLDPGFIERLKNHDFPENVRELRTIVAEAARCENGGTINLDSLSPSTGP